MLVLNTKNVDRFREPVSEEEVKATQKAAIPRNKHTHTHTHTQKHQLGCYGVGGLEQV